jgi:hypothetical protein
MPRRKSKDWIPTATFMLLVGAVFTWAFYRLIYTAIADGLSQIGVTGNYYSNVVIVVAMGIILVLGGKRITEMIK